VAISSDLIGELRQLGCFPKFAEIISTYSGA
jgi:hypothetical protein